MVYLSLYAFIPLGVLTVTGLIGTAIALAARSAAPSAPRRARPVRSAQILYFPVPVPQRRGPMRV